MAANTDAMLIVKITNGTEIRRFTSQSTNLTWPTLSKRTRELFELKPTRPLKLTYKDDENDVITLSSDTELTEAKELALKASPAVLRLNILANNKKDDAPNLTEGNVAPTFADASPQATPTTTDRASGGGGEPEDMNALFHNLAKNLPALLSQLPVRNLIPHAELDVAATIAANAAANAPCAAAAAAAAAHAAEAAAAASQVPPSADSPTGVHIGVTCDRSGMCPIVGMRYHLVGHNYDLCEAEFEKLTEKEKALYQRIPPPFVHHMPHENTNTATGFHPGVECDRSGMTPIVGNRYHMRGHNYDLCQAEFDKLSAQEKLLYTVIPPPVHAAAAAAAGAGANGPWRQGWGGGGCRWGPRQGMGGGHGCHGWGGGMVGHAGPKLAARFVRDVTVFDGTQMAPSTAFTKIWRLKNTGEIAWPPGTKMLYVGGDQMTTEMSVPLARSSAVQPGEEVDVAVEMVAPAELGRYLGYWRLVGPYGRRKFGQRVWCHVQVVDPSDQNTTSLNEADLAAMSAEIEAEIERKKSDLCADDKDDDTDMTDDNPPPPTNSPAVEAAPASTSTAPVAATAKDVALPDVTDPAAPLVPTSLGEPISADDAFERASDDEGVLVSAADVKMGDESASSSGTSLDLTSPIEEVTKELAAMGFTDPSLIEIVLDRHGADLNACARDLAAATEWDSLLDDLNEMGFANRELNKTLLLKHSGNVKRTVRELVEDA